jgi:hypothetical protein
MIFVTHTSCQVFDYTGLDIFSSSRSQYCRRSWLLLVYALQIGLTFSGRLFRYKLVVAGSEAKKLPTAPFTNIQVGYTAVCSLLNLWLPAQVKIFCYAVFGRTVLFPGNDLVLCVGMVARAKRRRRRCVADNCHCGILWHFRCCTCKNLNYPFLFSTKTNSAWVCYLSDGTYITVHLSSWRSLVLRLRTYLRIFP